METKIVISDEGHLAPLPPHEVEPRVPARAQARQPGAMMPHMQARLVRGPLVDRLPHLVARAVVDRQYLRRRGQPGLAEEVADRLGCHLPSVDEGDDDPVGLRHSALLSSARGLWC